MEEGHLVRPSIRLSSTTVSVNFAGGRESSVWEDECGLSAGLFREHTLIVTGDRMRDCGARVDRGFKHDKIQQQVPRFIGMAPLSMSGHTQNGKQGNLRVSI